MCLLCQRNPARETSVLQEVFHEIGLGKTPQKPLQVPANRLPWRERRAQNARTAANNSLLKEVLENL